MQCLTLDTNLKVRATTQYKNYQFNSMVKFGNHFLGASDKGLFSLGGNDDDGIGIDAEFEIIATDLGIPNEKRNRYLYFGFDSDDDLEVEIKADSEETGRTYPIVAHKEGQQGSRVTVGRDGKGRYWSILVRNDGGGAFAVDSIYVLPIVRPHGVV